MTKYIASPVQVVKPGESIDLYKAGLKAVLSTRPFRKKTYVIRYEETSIGYYNVEANSEEEALSKFRHDVNDGDIDFSYMDVISTSTTVEEVQNEDC